MNLDLKSAAEGHSYESGKVYCHNIGLSACFRQWRAQSHCRFLHGYALQVEAHFVTQTLDERNWVVDFGSLKSFKGWLERTFDHKTLVAEDDPLYASFTAMEDAGLIQMVTVPATGCEAFARMIFEYLEGWLKDNGYNTALLDKVTVREHSANFASYRRFC
jgi:6-pyruvoyltetrahydropterin/6-carboxytetrahydropterin synthase